MGANTIGSIGRPVARAPLSTSFIQINNPLPVNSSHAPGLFHRDPTSFFIKDPEEFMKKFDLTALVEHGLISEKEFQTLAFMHPNVARTLTNDAVIEAMGVPVCSFEDSYNYNDVLGGRGL